MGYKIPFKSFKNTSYVLEIGSGTPIQNADSLSVIFSSKNYWQTLTDDEVNQLQEKLRQGLVKKLGVELR